MNGEEPRKGKIFGDGYSELFFLDEATAYSAGNRPCWDCDRLNHKRFRGAWREANPSALPATSTSIDDIDAMLHRQCLNPDASKATYQVDLAGLPHGTFVDIAGEAYVVWKGQLLLWSFDGYQASRSIKSAPKRVTVLTPPSIVAMFASGYEVDVHPTAKGR